MFLSSPRVKFVGRSTWMYSLSLPHGMVFRRNCCIAYAWSVQFTDRHCYGQRSRSGPFSPTYGCMLFSQSHLREKSRSGRVCLHLPSSPWLCSQLGLPTSKSFKWVILSGNFQSVLSKKSQNFQTRFLPRRYRRGSHGMIATEGEELKMLESNGITQAYKDFSQVLLLITVTG